VKGLKNPGGRRAERGEVHGRIKDVEREEANLRARRFRPKPLYPCPLRMIPVVVMSLFGLIFPLGGSSHA
jgi:hypothetical protein